jgi:hypothetical protein
MESKKINQLATNVAPVSTDLTIIGDPITGVSKKITLLQLAAIFSGSIAFYTNYAAFPATGVVNTIYCAKDTQKLYLWSGSAYVETFPSQAVLNTYQLLSEKGVSNGYASLDSGGKVPIAQLPASIMEYKGMWNASTNTPTLANGTGDTGDVYICNVAGSVNFGAGVIVFAVGDYVIYSGSIWQRSSGAVGTVTSVGISTNGNSITIGSSPITTSGTITANFAGTSLQYINGLGNLITFPILTGYVPYTGATQDVDLGAFKLNAQSLHAKGTGGLGHLGLKHQSASATASANEVSLFADSLGDLGWLNGNLYLSKFITSSNTAARSYTFPNASGTIALTSNLSSYVPYTGATANLDLGIYSITAGIGTFTNGVLNGNGTNPANLYLKKGSSPFFTNAANYGLIAAVSSSFILISDVDGTNYKYASFNLGSLTNNTNRAYTLPDASGTIALTSDLGSYLPLAGGTLTGTTSFDGSGGTQNPITLIYNTSVNRILAPVLRLYGATSISTNYVELFGLNATQNRTIQFPDASGTVALTSNLSAYLPLAGGTLTGTLNSNSLIYTSLNFKTDSSVAFKNITSGGNAPSSLAGYSQLFFDNYQIMIRKADNQSITIRYPSVVLSQTWDFNVEGYIAVQYLASQTTGGVSFVRSTGQFTQDATKFFWDDTNKRLAIGNAAPSYTLDVSGTGRFTGALTTGGGVNIGATSFTSPSGADTILGVYGGQDCSLILQDNVQLWELYVNDDFYINRGATTALTILRSSGNVGIGTSSPADFIDASLGLAIISTSGRTGLSIGSTQGTANEVLGRLSFTNTNSTNIGSKRLAYISGIRGTSDNSAYLEFGTADNALGTQRMVISQGGNVGINCTADYQFQVNANTTNFVAMIKNTSTTYGNGLYLYSPNNSSSSTNEGFLRAENSAGIKAYIYTNGAFGSATNTYGSLASDIRLKENITDATPKLDDLLKLRVVNFNLIEDLDKRKQIGFIAQEFKEVFPSLVYERDTREYDEEGNIKKGLEDAMAISVPMDFAILVKAIQEQQAIITSLQEQINELKNK